MTKIKSKIKYLFTREVFRGQNDRMEFFAYHFLLSLVFVLPASTYLKLEDTPSYSVNLILLVSSLFSLLFGLYLISINTIRRANKTVAPFMKYIGIPALIISNIAVYPLTILYQLVVIILLLLPDRKH